MSSRSRHHLTITAKNRLRRHHKRHPELTQEQLREWTYATFGQWIARSTVGHIVRAPEEISGNPEATRFQSGRYPVMEEELYAFIETRGREAGVRKIEQLHGNLGLVVSDADLWTKANEILKRTRGSDESVSVAWVPRFKKRHGLHRLQLKTRNTTGIATARTEEREEMQEEIKQFMDKTNNAVVAMARNEMIPSGGIEMEDATRTLDQVKKRLSTAVAMTSSASGAVSVIAAAPAGTRSHFVSSDDMLLLTHVLAIKPWEFPYAMDGWQQVVEKLRLEDTFRLDKTAGACYARMNLLLGHMKVGNTTALRKSGTETDLDRKCELIAEVASQIEKYARMSQKGNDKASVQASAQGRGVAQVRQEMTTACVGMRDHVQGRKWMALRRLELMERKMDRELAAQKRHSEEQVARLEKLHHEQQQMQQEQHAQLLATIQQQQAMMFDLIRSVSLMSNRGSKT